MSGAVVPDTWRARVLGEDNLAPVLSATVVLGWAVPKSETCLRSIVSSLSSLSAMVNLSGWACPNDYPAGTLSQMWGAPCPPASSTKWRFLSWRYPYAHWGCLVRLFEPTVGESASARVPGVSETKSLWRSCRTWLPAKQSLTVERFPKLKLHHQDSGAWTCRLTLRAAVRCCLRSEVSLSLCSPCKKKWREPAGRELT